MKKILMIGLVFWMVFGICSPLSRAHQGETHATVVEVMRQSSGYVAQFQRALKAEDYFRAAESLMGLAQAIKSLEAVTPEQGDKADWDEIHQAIIAAAFKGIGSCGERDDAALRGYGDEIRLLMQRGHTLFK